ncbi:MAG: xanthine dehydrogenase family protein subunit M, partial [Rhodococcus sp. (in: high G+C Gram-positive bacteria)]|uniref:FAD binding domain-containing protein n=1 Tax=Rhodococcus sp. TaxID=1831 RepID=UPI003BAE2918
VHGELVTGVELPAPPPGNHAAYRKVRDRAAFAFALVSVAAEIVVDADRITSARIALGGVAHRPWRAVRAEEVLVGSPPSEDVFAEAAEIELAEAHPLPGNEFKVALTRRVLASMLRSLTGQVEHGQVEQ